MLINMYYHTKYDTKKLKIIHKTIKNYNSNIYNKQKIFNLIKKKEKLIQNYVKSHNILYDLKTTIHFYYLNNDKKNKIYNKIINISSNIIQLENNLKFLEIEENILFDVYKIKSNKLKYYIKKYFT